MELDRSLIYTTLGVLIATILFWKLIQRRIATRYLPPRFWSFDPFFNFDYALLTGLDATRNLTNIDQLGHTYRLATIFQPMTAIVSCHPDNVQAIASGKDWGSGYRLSNMKEMIGKGLITTDGDEWMRARKMMRPAFNRNNIDDFEVLEKVANELVATIEEKEGEVDVGLLLNDAFVNTSMQFILGLDAKRDSDGRPMSVTTFGKIWNQALLGMGLRLLLQSYDWILPSKYYQKSCAKLHSFVDFAIAQSHQRRTVGQLTNVKVQKSMVDILVAQTEDNDAQKQLMHTMLANQDTTSVLTSTMIQLLSYNPNIWKQLRDEVLTKGPEFLTYDALRDSKLIHNIQMETLRLRPVIPMLGRQALRDTVLPTGGGRDGSQPLPVPAGCTGICNLWSLSRNTDVFGPDLDTFKPDRWESVKPKPNEFVPFGLGPKACMGREKALVESAYLVVRLAERFERLEGRTKEWKPRQTVSMKNIAGYGVCFGGEGKG